MPMGIVSWLKLQSIGGTILRENHQTKAGTNSSKRFRESTLGSAS